MEKSTNDNDTRQARRIAEACKNGDQSCVEIVNMLLNGRPGLTDRQRATVVRAAVLLARYGVGCPRCKTHARHMHPEVRAAYVEKHGTVQYGCDGCKDTGTDYAAGLRCLACDHLTPLEGAVLVYLSQGSPSIYEALMGRIDAINTHVPPSLVVRAEQRFVATRLAVREESGAVIISPQGHRRARLIFAAHAPAIQNTTTKGASQ